MFIERRRHEQPPPLPHGLEPAAARGAAGVSTLPGLSQQGPALGLCAGLLRLLAVRPARALCLRLVGCAQGVGMKRCEACALAVPPSGPPEHWLIFQRLILCGRCAQPQAEDAEVLAQFCPVPGRVLH